LKRHILATRRSGRNAALLAPVKDLSDLRLYPPGEDEHTDHYLPSDAVLPGDTLESNPILVIVGELKGLGRELTPLWIDAPVETEVEC